MENSILTYKSQQTILTCNLYHERENATHCTHIDHRYQRADIAQCPLVWWHPQPFSFISAIVSFLSSLLLSILNTYNPYFSFLIRMSLILLLKQMTMIISIQARLKNLFPCWHDMIHNQTLTCVQSLVDCNSNIGFSSFLKCSGLFSYLV